MHFVLNAFNNIKLKYNITCCLHLNEVNKSPKNKFTIKRRFSSFLQTKTFTYNLFFISSHRRKNSMHDLLEQKNVYFTGNKKQDCFNLRLLLINSVNFLVFETYFRNVCSVCEDENNKLIYHDIHYSHSIHRRFQFM